MERLLTGKEMQQAIINNLDLPMGQAVAKAQDAKTERLVRPDERAMTLREVGELLDTQSFDVKSYLPTWFIRDIQTLKSGQMP